MLFREFQGDLIKLKTDSFEEKWPSTISAGSNGILKEDIENWLYCYDL